jgi:uncharacterized protein (TIGR03083 family)
MMPGMQGLERPGPVETIHLYPEERSALLGVLGDLNDAEWERPTVCAGWSVRDIALHLLADDLGVLSRQRDEHRSLAPRPDESLGVFLARINDEWVQATRRLSGRVIVDLLGWTGNETYGHFSGVDPLALGGAVSWAGPGPAPRWLDIAREYTERWVHQQQIREAVGEPLLDDARWLGPVLATFARALPRTFAAVEAPGGTTVSLMLDGDGGGAWTVVRSEPTADRGTGEHAWELFVGRPEAPGTPRTAEARMSADTAWRLFTKGLTPEAAAQQTALSGDVSLARQVLRTVAIIA